MSTPVPKHIKVENNPEEADVEEGAVFLLEALNKGLTTKLEKAGIDPEEFVKFNYGTVFVGYICGKSGVRLLLDKFREVENSDGVDFVRCKWNGCEFRKRKSSVKGLLVAHVKEEHLKITTVPPRSRGDG